jgi:hypothetical protein
MGRAYLPAHRLATWICKHCFARRRFGAGLRSAVRDALQGRWWPLGLGGWGPWRRIPATQEDVVPSCECSDYFVMPTNSIGTEKVRIAMRHTLECLPPGSSCEGLSSCWRGSIIHFDRSSNPAVAWRAFSRVFSWLNPCVCQTTLGSLDLLSARFRPTA